MFPKRLEPIDVAFIPSQHFHRIATANIPVVRKFRMTDSASRPVSTRKTGLSPAQQKLQALLEKSAHAKSGAKPLPGASASGFKAKNSFTGKKTAFQRKAT